MMVAALLPARVIAPRVATATGTTVAVTTVAPYCGLPATRHRGPTVVARPAGQTVGRCPSSPIVDLLHAPFPIFGAAPWSQQVPPWIPAYYCRSCSRGFCLLPSLIPAATQPAQLPQSNNPNTRGRLGVKKKKKGQQHAGGSASAPSSSVPLAANWPVEGGAREAVPCFNCMLSGHYQVSFPNPPTCYLYKDPGHPVAMCQDRPMSEEIMMYGHGIDRLAFFHIKVPEAPPSLPSLCDVVTVLADGVASPEMIEDELNHLCCC
ncbi:hypothetical protein D1007_45452 [Hordeum vulgare]|nr:hypothetical protein D1007_45452 [Hordeum vulgare]